METKPAKPPTRHELGIDRRQFGNFARVRGIGVPSLAVFQTARALDADDARALKWFAGYARLLDRTADTFERELSMDAVTIRSLLLNEDADPALRASFTGAVNLMRSEFEARLDQPHTAEGNPFAPATPFHHALGKLANTQPVRETRKAVAFAESGGWGVTEGLERMGKTVSAAREYLRRLDEAAWVRVPSGDGMRVFLNEIGRAVGAPCSANGDSCTTITVRIGDVLGQHGIKLLFVDQFHAVLPVRSQRDWPERIEKLMDWHDSRGVAIVGIATPQWGTQLAALKRNTNYRSGQAEGRMRIFPLRETLTETELGAVAKSRAPWLNDAATNVLVRYTQQHGGYCGSMMSALARASVIYKDPDERREHGARLNDEMWRMKAMTMAIDEEMQLSKGVAK